MGNEQSNLNDTERRLTVLETKFEMLAETLTNAILRLEKKLDELSQNYITKESLESKLEIRDREISALKREVEVIKEDKKTNKQLFPAWGQTILALVAVFVSVYAILNK